MPAAPSTLPNPRTRVQFRASRNWADTALFCKPQPSPGWPDSRTRTTTRTRTKGACESCASRGSLHAHEYRAFKIPVDNLLWRLHQSAIHPFVWCRRNNERIREGRSGEAGNWVASWGCAPGFASGQKLANQTLRQFVRLSAGGNRVRVRLSNETGASHW